MPITNNGSPTMMEFGVGDIEVAPGWHKGDKAIGVVCFFQKDEPTPIGTPGVYEPMMEVEQEKTHVRMDFHRVESLDVVIRALQDTRRYMINANKE